MAYTQAHLDALKSALASGATQIRYEDRMLEFRDVDQLIKAIAVVEGELASAAGTSRQTRSFAKFSKG
jgi:hypothetical protein